MKNKSVLVFSLLTSLCIAACGGSGGSGSISSPSNPAPPVPAPVNPITTLPPLKSVGSVDIFGSDSLTTDAAAGFVVLGKDGAQISEVNWSQTAGPNLVILANNSQTIGFDVSEAGNYTLQAEISFVGRSEKEIATVSFSAVAEQAEAAIRLDHEASELSKVSLHVDTASGKTIDSIEWTQTAGPAPTNLTKQDEFLFFDAPSVSSDAIIEFTADVTFTDGSSATDKAMVMVKNVNFDSQGLFYSANSGKVITASMHAYKSDSPFKQSLESCVYGNNIPNPPTCTFNDLPLIGMQSANPTVEDVLNQTLVSHQWMGDSFKNFLENSVTGPDMLALLRGVTAVVISYEVRPSFYWAATGAIYLDANNFWQTPYERDTLNDQPDYRSNFGSDLQFSVYWRYVKDNDYYPANRLRKNDRSERGFADVEASIAWLMYHELAHANDYFPPGSWSSVSQSTTPLQHYRQNGASSDSLVKDFPLTSSEMHALAQVRFRNTDATNTQKNYSGSDIETFFVPDISPSFYSYLTQYEDFATLAERFFMLYRLGADADVAIIDGELPSGDPLVVWGQRNRISEPSLEDRTVFAVNRVYPELDDVRNKLRALKSPQLMTANRGWFENLDLSNNPQRLNSNRLSVPYSLEYIKQRSLADSQDIHQGKPKL